MPFLLVVPNSLVYQWRSEFRNFTRAFGFDLFPFNSSTEKKFFTDPSSIWNLSKLSPGRRVVIASSDSIRKAAKSIYIDVKNAASTDPWKPRPYSSGGRARLPGSIFDQRWQIVFFDEAHTMRNKTSMFAGITMNARAVVALTATPLVTSFMVRTNLLTHLISLLIQF